MLIAETAYEGFEMDWVLKNDFTVCNFEMECPADAYALYNLQGDLASTRTESLKVEFGDTKLSLRQFFKKTHFPILMVKNLENHNKW